MMLHEATRHILQALLILECNRQYCTLWVTDTASDRNNQTERKSRQKTICCKEKRDEK